VFVKLEVVIAARVETERCAAISFSSADGQLRGNRSTIDAEEQIRTKAA